MTVYVITQADFPRAVVQNQARALEIVAAKNAGEQKEQNDRLAGYWRVHHFTLDQEPS